MKITSNTLFKVYNFHKDNWTDIWKVLSIHFIYAAFVAMIPTAIYMNNALMVFTAFALTYSMFSVVIQIRLETVYGKALRALACTLGAFISWYSMTHYMIFHYIFNLF